MSEPERGTEALEQEIETLSARLDDKFREIEQLVEESEYKAAKLHNLRNIVQNLEKENAVLRGIIDTCRGCSRYLKAKGDASNVHA